MYDVPEESFIWENKYFLLHKSACCEMHTKKHTHIKANSICLNGPSLVCNIEILGMENKSL